MANTEPQIADKKLTIVSKTKNSISLRWTKATDKETPQSKLLYTVTWCIAPYVWDNNVRKIGERKYDNSSYTITGLTPNTTYDIYLYVRDESGCENVYAKATVTTLEENVSSAPSTNQVPVIPHKDVRAVTINTNSIKIEWDKATDAETPQNQLQYTILYSVAPYSNDTRKQTKYLIDSTSYTITGLAPDTTYSFYVYVYDGKNFSRYNEKKVKTASPVVSSAVTGNRKEDINNYLRGITYSPANLINNDLYNDTTVYPRFIENKLEGAGYILETKQTKITNEEIYVRGSGYENIYPGSILVVDPEITSGSPNPLGYVSRKPVTIFGDFLAGSTTKQEISSPTNDSVREACNNIMRILLSDTRYKAPGVQRPNTKIYTNKKSMMLDFKVDASFAGVSLNASAKTDSSEQSFVHATTLEQDYFTVKLSDAWKQDPSSLFGDSVTLQTLKNAVSGKALAIVTSVTYGRTFSYLKEYSAKKFTYDGSQKVVAYGQTASSTQKTEESNEYTHDSIFNLGGTPLTIEVLRGKRTQAELETAMANNMEFSSSNQGVVTKYTLQLITGTNPGKVLKPSYNGTTYETNYIRCPHTLQVEVNVAPVYIGGPGGGDVHVHIDSQIIRKTSGRDDNGRAIDDYQVVATINGDSPSKVQDPWWYTFNNTGTRTYGKLADGEYIYHKAKLRVRARSLKTKSYSAHDEQYFDLSSGNILVKLDGSVLKRVKIKEISNK